MENRIFNDTLDLWIFIFENAMNKETTKMEDDVYSRYVDKLFDDVCMEIKNNGQGIMFNTIIKVEGVK